MSLKTEIDKVNENTNNIKTIKANIDNEFNTLGETPPTNLNDVPTKINSLATSLSIRTLDSAKKYTDSKVGDVSTLKTKIKDNTVVAINSLFDDKTDKSKKHNIALRADGWKGSKAPYTYSITIPGMDTEKNWEVTNSVNPMMTVEELNAFSDGRIICGTQTTDTVNLIAYGKKPTININILIIVRGD